MTKGEIAGMKVIPKGYSAVDVGGTTMLKKTKARRKSGMTKAQKNRIRQALSRPSLIAGGSVAVNILEGISDGLNASGNPAQRGAKAVDSFASNYTGISRYKTNDAKSVFLRLAQGWGPLLALAIASKFGLTKRLGKAMKGLPVRQ